MTVPPEHREFARQAELSLTVDPGSTFDNLSKATGVPVDTLIHHALVRWTQALTDLIEARKAEDWPKVAGIIDWLEAGFNR